MVLKICVMGAGVVGLTTATMIQEKLPNAQVFVIAEKFLTETTSCVAAGIFRAGDIFPGPDKETSRKWLTNSYQHYKKLLNGEKSNEKVGVKELIGYMLSNLSNVSHPFMKGVIDECRSCTEEELSRFATNPKYGEYHRTLLIENRLYLPYLHEIFTKNGGKIIGRKINSFDELVDSDCDLIFNCTGLGSKQLCDDIKVLPVRGQVYKVRCPEIQEFVYADDGVYIIPGFDTVTLGGTKQIDSYDLRVNKHDSVKIWENGVRTLPALQNGQIERECVGLRPYRYTCRVEQEIKNINGKQLKIVHNYGHGFYGVMSSPGTSIDAVNLGLQMLNMSHLSSKL